MLKSVTSAAIPLLPPNPRPHGGTEGTARNGTGAGRSESDTGRAPAMATGAAETRAAVTIQVANRDNTLLDGLDIDNMSASDVNTLLQSTAEQLAGTNQGITSTRGLEELNALFQ